MFRIYCLLMSFILFITGCGYLDGYRTESMGLVAAHIVSISESRPAEVVIAVHGIHSDTCAKSTGILSAKLKGNEIRINAKQEVGIGPGGCGDAITDIYAEDTVHNLDVGEYVIMDDYDNEFGSFRIEQDAAYVDADIVDYSLIITPPSSEAERQDDPTFHLKLSVDLYLYDEIYYINECKPNFKDDIKRSEDVIIIDISRVVPITDTGCKIRVNGSESNERRSNPSKRRWYQPYNTEIELGTFSKGSYRAVMNGSEFHFDLPMNSN